jgi:glutamate decarboxylase
MEPEVGRLMTECLPKNMIDKDEYPQTAEIEHRCVSMLADLWHTPDPSKAPGCSTVGSSEACMLGGLAMKRRWQVARRAAGKPADKPNIVMGVNVQVCWDKFANYFEVEPRLVPMEGDRFHLNGEEAVKLVDENTIGVVAVLGSTFDGSYEPVAEIAAALDALQERTGLDVPIHVDGASGGMIAPFLDPELEWDFRVPRVASISTSGHKYGLVFPGVGWVIWRDQAALPEELIYHVNYLGGDMPTFALNFSRPGAQIVAQYYMFLRLGLEGYRLVHAVCRDVAGDIARKLPVVALKMKPAIDNFTVFDVSRRLRERGWQVPAYTFPKNREDLAVLRIVVRNGFSHDLAALFLADLERLLPELERQSEPLDKELAVSFRH